MEINYFIFRFQLVGDEEILTVFHASVEYYTRQFDSAKILKMISMYFMMSYFITANPQYFRYAVLHFVILLCV